MVWGLVPIAYLLGTFPSAVMVARSKGIDITSVAGKITIQKTNTPPWTFASNCAAAAGLCSTTEFAGTPTITPAVVDDPTGMLCGK